jgi:DNA-binding SARP family transcriptional activator
MERIRYVGVLGGLGLRPPDRLSGIGRRVVAYLAVRGPRTLRGLVGAQLWPDLPERRVRANFRRALWQLPDGWVVPDGSDLVLAASVDIVDARESARRAIRGGELTWEEIELLSRDLLPGWFENWVIDERDSFSLLSVQALEAACRTAALAGDYTLATHAGYLAVRSDPLRESAVVALVEAHLGEGNRCLAVKRYRTYVRLLDEELHTTPGEQLEQLVGPLIDTV